MRFLRGVALAAGWAGFAIAVITLAAALMWLALSAINAALLFWGVPPWTAVWITPGVGLLGFLAAALLIGRAAAGRDEDVDVAADGFYKVDDDE